LGAILEYYGLITVPDKYNKSIDIRDHMEKREVSVRRKAGFMIKTDCNIF